MSNTQTRVLYIAGSGRSGTTLVSRILGQLRTIASIGELRNLWLLDPHRELCGCGQLFAECPFWQPVFTKAFGGMQEVDFRQMLALRQEVDRVRFIPGMISPQSGSKFEQRLIDYRDVLVKLYRAISEVSGCEVILDSSKHSATLYLLLSAPEIELDLLHQVRDSRAVAYSWTRRVPRRQAADGTGYMRRYSLLESVRSWTYQNLLATAAKTRSHDYLRMRYEDFVRNPRYWTEKIAAMVGIENPNLDFVTTSHVDFTIDNHTASGNPMRFDKGRVALRPDDAWREQMNWRSKVLITALTWPLLWQHGYFRNK